MKKRGNNGRFVTSSSEPRGDKVSFRVTAENKIRLQEVAESRGITKADLFDEWIANGCPTSETVSMEGIKNKLVNAFVSKFASRQKVGRQSSIYKNARSSLLAAIKEVMAQE